MGVVGAGMGAGSFESYFWRFDLGSRSRGYFIGFVSVGDAASVQVVWGELHLHFVAGQNSDVMHPHFPGYVRQNDMVVVKFDLEHGVRERFHNRPCEDDCFFF